MPRYEYACTECDNTAERHRPMDERHHGPDCPLGHGEMELQISLPSGGIHSDLMVSDNDPHITESELDELAEQYDESDFDEHDYRDWEAVDE